MTLPFYNNLSEEKIIDHTKRLDFIFVLGSPVTFFLGTYRLPYFLI